MSRSDLVDVSVEVTARTEKAALVHTGDKEKSAWVPLSQVELVESEAFPGIWTLTLAGRGQGSNLKKRGEFGSD